MSPLRIPEKYQEGVSQIRQLDEETAKRIRADLDRVYANQNLKDGGAVNPDEIATTALAAVPALKTPDFKAIVLALVALYTVKSARDAVSVEDFAQDVSNAMKALKREELRLQPDEQDRFKRVLVTLLSSDVFAISTKAFDLKTDDERTFCHARILTDLRPVFGDRVEDGPKAMVLVHLLQLGYHQGSDKHQKFYVSLDAEDLEELRRVVDRAEAKAKTLKSVLKDIRLFGSPKE